VPFALEGHLAGIPDKTERGAAPAGDVLALVRAPALPSSHPSTVPLIWQQVKVGASRLGVDVDRWVSWLDSDLWTMRNPFLGTSAGEAWLRRQQV
jgi:hypothetical protein